MPDYQYDLFVIGAGSGGVRAARVAAKLGARVALAESRYLGGTCVNVGCVPKKLFFYASHFSEEFKHATDFGWSSTMASFDWKTLIGNKNNAIKRLNDIYRNLLDGAGVEIITGHATITGEHEITVADRKFTAERILIATGAQPYIPDLPANREYIISSDDAFYLKSLPKQIIIVGGGYIAVEFAGIFNGLGVETVLLYRGDLFLRGFDEELRKQLATAMRRKGIDVQFGVTVAEITRTNNTLNAILDDGRTFSAGEIMYATGRRPDTQNLGLENVGIKPNTKGAIAVNAHYQTDRPSIYAIGDVTDRVNLTPVAIAEGMALAEHLYADQPINIDYANIPTCVFSQPGMASVGLSEEAARAQYNPVKIYRSCFTPMKLSMSPSEKNEKILIKLIVDGDNDRVLGAHILGPDAGEIIQGIAIAIKAGATKKDFDSTIGIHPTIAEEFVTLREVSAE